MNEHSFIRAIHRHLSKKAYSWKINDRFAGGVADSWYCGREGKHLFVEYKYVKLPARPDTVMRAALSELQQRWLQQRKEQGIPVAVVLGAAKKGVISDDIEELVDGIRKEEFDARAVPFKDLAHELEKRIGLRNYS